MEAAFILLLQEDKGVGREGQAENYFRFQIQPSITISTWIVSLQQSPVSVW